MRPDQDIMADDPLDAAEVVLTIARTAQTGEHGLKGITRLQGAVIE